MNAPVLLCLPVHASDPCSRRKVSVAGGAASTTSRRRFLALVGGGLTLPLLLPGRASTAEFVSKDVEPAKLWDGDRQLVFAYKQGETLGELCQRLDDARDELPVSIIWRLPPNWVNVFPTIHFEVSSRRWKKYDSWQDREHFVQYYERFNPPPKSADQTSPFKTYAAGYDGPEWTYPGEVADHLLDPNSLHRFSQFEISGLSQREMENLHAAHHEELIDPGRRPPEIPSKTPDPS